MRRLALVGLTALVMAGCVDSVGNAPVTLRMVSIEGQGTSGNTATSDAGAMLLSDVVWCGSYYNDNALLTLDLIAKNPDLEKLGSNLNDVQLERYKVSFFRSDGHNTEGVGVPYSFMGGLSGLVGIGGTLETAIIVVRHTAKLEPPIRNLEGAGSEDIVSATAQITVWGRTGKGDVVEASGYLPVTFADFGDGKCPAL
jgi:hypothetical protein